MIGFSGRSLVTPRKIIAGLAAFFFIKVCLGADVMLTWDPSASPDVAAYRVYYGTVSGGFAGFVQVPFPSTNATVRNLKPGVTYYFSARAVGPWGHQSWFSNQSTYTPPTADPINLSAVEDTGVNITLRGRSAANAPLSYSLESEPSLGTLSGTPPNLVYTPKPNMSGTDQFTYSVCDGGGRDYATVSIQIAEVNDPPTIDPPAGIILPQNAGPQVVQLTGISSGNPAVSQKLTVTAKSNAPGRAADPVVSYVSPSPTATLTFTPKPGAVGWVVFTICVNNGGATNNVATQSFWVLLNNLPTLDPIPDVWAIQDWGPRTIALTGISPGAANETNQMVGISAQSSNPALIPRPSILYTNGSATGLLTFKPTLYSTGSSIITVFVWDGEYGNNLLQRTFKVTVDRNHPPTLNPLEDLTLPSNAPKQTVKLSGITPGPPGEVQTLVVSASSSNPALIPMPEIIYTSPGNEGYLTFTPAINQRGAAVLSVKVSDGASVDNSITQTMVVTVSDSVVISGVQQVGSDARTVRLQWNVDVPAACYVEYGTDQLDNFIAGDSTGTFHTIELPYLLPGTNYTVRITATSQAGDSSVFITTARTENLATVLWQAEDGELVAPMAVMQSELARFGRYVGGGSQQSGSATYVLDVLPSHSYRLWARVKAPVGGDYLFGSIDGGAAIPLFAPDDLFAGHWHWTVLTTDAEATNITIFPMETGTRRLKITPRVAEFLIDEFALSNDPLWAPVSPFTQPELLVFRTSASTAMLTWIDPSGNAEHVAVEYSSDAENFELLAIRPANETALNVQGLGPQTYYFRIYSYNEVDRSDFSITGVASYGGN